MMQKNMNSRRDRHSQEKTKTNGYMEVKRQEVPHSSKRETRPMTKFNLRHDSLEEFTVGKTHILAEGTDLIRAAYQRLQISLAKCPGGRKCSGLEIFTNSLRNTDRGRGDSCVLRKLC